MSDNMLAEFLADFAGADEDAGAACDCGETRLTKPKGTTGLFNVLVRSQCKCMRDSATIRFRFTRRESTCARSVRVAGGDL